MLWGTPPASRFQEPLAPRFCWRRNLSHLSSPISQLPPSEVSEFFSCILYTESSESFSCILYTEVSESWTAASLARMVHGVRAVRTQSPASLLKTAFPARMVDGVRVTKNHDSNASLPFLKPR